MDMLDQSMGTVWFFCDQINMLPGEAKNYLMTQQLLFVFLKRFPEIDWRSISYILVEYCSIEPIHSPSVKKGGGTIFRPLLI